MKLTVLLSAAAMCILWTSVSDAQNVWACQGLDTTGFAYLNGRYVRQGFTSSRYLIKVHSLEASVKRDDKPEYKFRCQEMLAQPGLECQDGVGGFLLFDVQRGTGALAEMLGAISTGQHRDTISISLISCTKF
jgi:hypothetical protein